MSGRAPDSCSAPYRVRFDEGGPDGLIRTSVLLRYTQDLAGVSLVEPRVRAVVVRRARDHLARPRGGGRGRRPDRRSERNWSGRRPSSAGAASGPDGGPSSTTPRARSSRGSTSTGSCSTTGAPRPASRRSSMPSSAHRRRHSAWPASISVRSRPSRPARRSRSGPRSSTRWITSTTRSTRTGSTRRCIVAGGGSATRAVPRLVRLEYARAAEPAARLVADAWPDGGGWVCRVADADGSDLLRSRLEPLGRANLSSRAPARDDPRWREHERDDRPGLEPGGLSGFVACRARRRRSRPSPRPRPPPRSGHSSPRPAIGCACVRLRASGPHSNASAISPTRRSSWRPVCAGSWPRTSPTSSATTRPCGSPGSSTTRMTRLAAGHLRSAARRQPGPLGATIGRGPRARRPSSRTRRGELRHDLPPQLPATTGSTWRRPAARWPGLSPADGRDTRGLSSAAQSSHGNTT